MTTLGKAWHGSWGQIIFYPTTYAVKSYGIYYSITFVKVQGDYFYTCWVGQ